MKLAMLLENYGIRSLATKTFIIRGGKFVEGAGPTHEQQLSDHDMWFLKGDDQDY